MPAPVSELGYAKIGAASWWVTEDEPAPELRWPLSVEVYDRMRSQDAQVASVLRAVSLPIRRTNWWIDPAGARLEVARQIADDLGLSVHGETSEPKRTRDRFSWAEHLRLALLMLPFGHSVFEQVYRLDSGLLRLRKLAWRPPRTITAFNAAPDGGLLNVEQPSPTPGRAPITIPVDRLVVYVHDREGANWTGRSLLRPAYKHWLLKDRLIRVQAQTIDRNGMGIPVYEAADDEDDLSKGLAMAKGYRSGESAGAAIPYGAKLRLLGVEGRTPDADPAIRYHDEQIARAVLAHFLNLGTQTGSWALGATFADFFTLSLQTLAQQIADVATQHVIEDLVDANWGTDEPAPRLAFEEIGTRQAATAQAIKLLTDAGVLHPDVPLEQATRQTYGLPAADPATREAADQPISPPEQAPNGDSNA